MHYGTFYLVICSIPLPFVVLIYPLVLLVSLLVVLVFQIVVLVFPFVCLLVVLSVGLSITDIYNDNKMIILMNII